MSSKKMKQQARGPASKTSTSLTRSGLREVTKETLAREVETARKQIKMPAQDLEYLHSVFDPLNTAPQRSPTNRGGYPGQTKLQKLTAKNVTCTVGTNGVGVVGFTPRFAGPFNDRCIGAVTTGAYAGTTADTWTTFSGAVGVQGFNWDNSVWAAAGLPAAHDGQLLSRCVASAIYISSDSAAMSQDGHLSMIDFPGHAAVNGSTLVQAVQHPRARKVKGAMFGNPDVTICCQSIPRASVSMNQTRDISTPVFVDDAYFAYIWGNLTTAQSLAYGPEAAIIIQATAGTKFSVTFCAIYESIGRLASDSSQVAPSWNPFAEPIMWKVWHAHQLSGWVGTPEEQDHSVNSVVHWAESVVKGIGRPLLNKGLELAKEVTGFALPNVVQQLF